MGNSTFYVFYTICAAASLCKYSCAEWNATKEPANKRVFCGPHGNGSQCAAVEEAAQRSHFSKCPKEYRHYCIHGRCRYVTEQDTPSCVCTLGYTGHRCEFVDFDLQTGEPKKIIIACVITALVFLLLVIVFICICVHRRKLCWKRKKRKEEKTGEVDKLNMNATHETKERLSLGAETSETNAV